MKKNAPVAMMCHQLAIVGTVCLLTIFSGSRTVVGKLETWREENANAFGKGRRDRVVVSDIGWIRLGHELKAVGGFKAARVWDLARGAKGDLFAATGDEGKVFHRAPDGSSEWEPVYDAKDTQALSLAIGKDGHVFVGTGPSGRVVDVTDPAHPDSRPDPGVQYIWDLAADAAGNLFAATGPTGQLWKKPVDGDWKLLFDSKHSHLLSVALGPDGAVYSGSDGEGLVYKVSPDGKASVLYDAPQSEVRTLIVSPDGDLYAGTASEAGGGSGRGSFFSPPSSESSTSRDSDAHASSGGATRVQETPPKPEAPKKEEVRAKTSGSTAGGSAAPRPVSAGDNAVYRIDREGVAREVFRAKVLVFALAFRKDRLLVGTGPEGQLYEVRESGHESSPIARLDNGQILSLLCEPDETILIGTGDPGGVVRLDPGYVSSGTLTSSVKDTKLVSRFGAISWRAETPEKTRVTVQVRSGNVAEPDSTWSEWSNEQSDPGNSRAKIPAGRFVQYRAKLSTQDSGVSPRLHGVSLRYQSANLPPEIVKLDVPDVSALDGATKQSRLTFRWDVNDPNDDELHYSLHLRKEGWPDWVKLNEQPLSEKSFAWDTTSVPAGHYRVRITASDRPSNNEDDALSRDRVSDPFIVDHEAPSVSIKSENRKAGAVIKDGLTRITKAAYAIDGGEWNPIFPDDGLFDTPVENLTIPLSILKPGTHVLMVRGTDAAGNAGSADILIEIR